MGLARELPANAKANQPTREPQHRGGNNSLHLFLDCRATRGLESSMLRVVSGDVAATPYLEDSNIYIYTYCRDDATRTRAHLSSTVNKSYIPCTGYSARASTLVHTTTTAHAVIAIRDLRRIADGDLGDGDWRWRLA